MTAASQDEVRRNNLALVLRRLHLDGPVSRSELVALTGLNRSTVGDLVTELAAEGLVVEQPGASGSVGRPSLVVAPRAESAVTLAFDFRVERVVGAIVGIGGEIIARVDAPNTRTDVGPNAAVEQLLEMSHELLDAVPDDALWVGTGVGVPGVVDASNGMVKQAPNLNWIDVPLGELLSKGFRDVFGDVPGMFIGNDADLGAWAEHIRGAGAAAHNVIYISGEVGIGGGVVLNGQLMSGAGGYGGEIGHMVIDPDGDPCRCGSRGCWETLIGRNCVIHCLPGHSSTTDIADVIAALHAGDPQVREGLHQVGTWLGIGLGNLVNIFNPDVIVLGGHLSALLPEVHDEIDEHVGHALRASREQVHIVVPALGVDSTLVGAAESAFAPLLARPIEALRQSSTLVAL
ncbi:MAG: ROK family transcriptional regulator [Candidatus Nanopelagicales bacterium]